MPIVVDLGTYNGSGVVKELGRAEMRELRAQEAQVGSARSSSKSDSNSEVTNSECEGFQVEPVKQSNDCSGIFRLSLTKASRVDESSGCRCQAEESGPFGRRQAGEEALLEECEPLVSVEGALSVSLADDLEGERKGRWPRRWSRTREKSKGYRGDKGAGGAAGNTKGPIGQGVDEPRQRDQG